MIQHQSSPEIREFLVFYLLEQVSSRGLAPGRLGPEVARSSEGDLRPAEADLRAAQLSCWQSGWLQCAGPFVDESAALSPEGRLELDRRAESAQGGVGKGDPREEAADRVVSFLSPPDQREVLDVGTGDGFLAKRLAAAGFRVLGVDTDGPAIQRAGASVGPDAGPQFRVADIHALAEAGRRWPTVVTSYLLHECEDPVATLRAICLCLAPGGSFACIDFAPDLAAYLSRAGRTPFHPFRALAEGDWRHLAPQFGLLDVDYSMIGYVSLVTATKALRNAV